ncbi:ribose/xylose/arabinose/galactoside ABC-type transport system permease subunit [Mesorhizobium robiniae]|uniref:Ribose/xylose/arabinose/galactoside ABC-type transport system permease subunit n=1 Tax=Mesorhizobium robiniae TaxID=559315 RepID=A0ABV2GFW1_9HYPH
MATILVLIVTLSWLTPYFLSPVNFANIGVAVSVTAIMAFVATIVLVSGGLDLSLGSVVALSGIALGQATAAGFSGEIAILAALGVGLGCGLLNSALIIGVGINPFIVTIGTQFLFRGLAHAWSSGGGNAILVQDELISFLGNGRFLGLPMPIYIMLLVLLAVYVLMTFTRLGAHIYAIGGSESAASRSGVSVGRVRTIVYCTSSVSAAIAGVVLVGITGAGISVAGMGSELTVVAGVILGGTSLMGGRGTVGGTVLGVIMLGVLNNGLTLLGVPNYWQIIVQGLALLLAVLADELRRKARERR